VSRKRGVGSLGADCGLARFAGSTKTDKIFFEITIMMIQPKEKEKQTKIAKYLQKYNKTIQENVKIERELNI